MPRPRRDVQAVKAPWSTTLVMRKYFQILQSNNAEVEINTARIVRASVTNATVPAAGLGTVPISFAINATTSVFPLLSRFRR